MIPDDVPYIMETWLGVLTQHRRRYAAPGEKWLNAGALLRANKALIRDWLYNARTAVACVPDSADAILGFATISYAGQTLMAYTRKSARGLGICTELFIALRKASP